MSKRLMSFLLALLTVAACNTPVAYATPAQPQETDPPAASDTNDSEETTEPAEDPESAEDTKAAEDADPAESAEAAEDGETAENTEPAEEAAPVYTSTLYVLGNPIAAEHFVLHKGNNYITLAEAMRIIDPEAVIQQANGTATVTTRGITITATIGYQYVEANGRVLYVPNAVQSVGDLAAIPVGTLATIFNMVARYDGTIKVAFVEAVEGAEPVLQSGNAFYNAYDLDLLSHIIYNEAGNQTLEGKLAVGNVVMNRVNSPLFPNTVDGVIYQKNQFVPRGSWVMTRTINAQSLIAAKLVMEGAVVMPNAFFFCMKGVQSWISANRAYVGTIGGIDFYA